MVFQFGLFHADPHPGNVLFLPGDRVGFIDFGLVGRLDPSERRRMALMLWALVDGDYDAVERPAPADVRIRPRRRSIRLPRRRR